jgi:hypothetical protein
MIERRVVATSLVHIHYRKKVKADRHGVSEHRHASLLQGITEPSLVDKTA